MLLLVAYYFGAFILICFAFVIAVHVAIVLIELLGKAIAFLFTAITIPFIFLWVGSRTIYRKLSTDSTIH